MWCIRSCNLAATSIAQFAPQPYVDEFFRLNPMCDIYIEKPLNVWMPALTHRYDNKKMQWFLLINGYDEGKYCLRFLYIYCCNIVGIGPPFWMMKMADMHWATIFLSGRIFTFQILQDLLRNFARLEFPYLKKTAFDTISMQNLLNWLRHVDDRRQFQRKITLWRYLWARYAVYARTMWRRFKYNEY